MNFDRQQDYEEATNDRLQKDIGRLKQSSKRSADWSNQVEATKTEQRIQVLNWIKVS